LWAERNKTPAQQQALSLVEAIKASIIFIGMQIKKETQGRILLFILLICLYSCNLNQSSLTGKYVIDKITADTISNNYLKEINLLNKDRVLLRYRDNDVLRGTWNEKKGIDYHYIKVYVNGSYKELEVYENIINDNSTKLYFMGNPSDFRGGVYDSLSFIKVE
jgi:hypothetical protein